MVTTVDCGTLHDEAMHACHGGVEFLHPSGSAVLGWHVQVEWKKFTDLRQQVHTQWHALPKTADVLSQPLKDKVEIVTARLRQPVES